MNNLFWTFLMFFCGIAVAVQPSINARLAQKIGAIESSMISFAVGTLALFIVVMVSGRGTLRGVATASWWELTGGFLGAFFVSMMIITVPRLGTAAVMASVIAGQLIAGAMLDHFGFFGLRHLPLTPLRVVGMILLFAGAALIIRR